MCERIVSREPGRHELLQVSGPLTWAELHAKLLLAEVALRAFRQRYYLFSRTMLTHYWNTAPEALPRAAPAAAGDSTLAALLRQVEELSSSLG